MPTIVPYASGVAADCRRKALFTAIIWLEI